MIFRLNSSLFIQPGSSWHLIVYSFVFLCLLLLFPLHIQNHYFSRQTHTWFLPGFVLYAAIALNACLSFPGDSNESLFTKFSETESCLCGKRGVNCVERARSRCVLRPTPPGLGQPPVPPDWPSLLNTLSLFLPIRTWYHHATGPSHLEGDLWPASELPWNRFQVPLLWRAAVRSIRSRARPPLAGVWMQHKVDDERWRSVLVLDLKKVPWGRQPLFPLDCHVWMWPL